MVPGCYKSSCFLVNGSSLSEVAFLSLLYRHLGCCSGLWLSQGAVYLFYTIQSSSILGMDTALSTTLFQLFLFGAEVRRSAMPGRWYISISLVTLVAQLFGSLMVNCLSIISLSRLFSLLTIDKRRDRALLWTVADGGKVQLKM